MMRHYFLFSAIALVATVTAPASTLENVLASLDRAAPKFTGMTADIERVTYTKVLDDKASESGTIAIRKQPKEMQVRIDLTEPDPKVVGFRGRKAEIYYPKLKTVQEFDLGKHSDLIDQFLMVGFGTGKELLANYDIQFKGEEMVAGQKTWKLELVPTASSVKKQLSRVDLWVAADGAYPVQQRFVQPSGDYNLATYSNVKLNPGLTEAAVALKLPRGVKREYPQK